MVIFDLILQSALLNWKLKQYLLYSTSFLSKSFYLRGKNCVQIDTLWGQPILHLSICEGHFGLMNWKKTFGMLGDTLVSILNHFKIWVWLIPMRIDLLIQNKNESQNDRFCVLSLFLHPSKNKKLCTKGIIFYSWNFTF